MKVKKQITQNSYFLVSEAFVDNFLDKLSGNAVKLYLLILSRFENGGIMYDPAASKDLHFSPEEYSAAMKELDDYGIITYEKGNFIEITSPENLSAGKAAFIDKRFETKVESSPEFAKELKLVIDTINKEFFGGKMPRKWLTVIEKYSKEYEFLPETIYLLFKECEKVKNGTDIGFKAYIDKVAENWYKSNVKTPEDVAKLADARNRRNEYITFVQKKLNFARPFTEAEINTILSWQNESITTEMLSVILDDTNRVSAITIDKIDKTLAQWKEAGVKTPEEARAFKLKKKTETDSQKKKPETNTQTHFENERTYSDDYLAELLKRDLDGGKK